MTNRRDLIKLLAAAPLLSAIPREVMALGELSGGAKPVSKPILRKIPTSGEMIPSVGMGSYQTFNISNSSPQKENLLKVLQAFFEAGGQLIDSSPMYGRSESVIGELVSQIAPKPDFFAASKVWTYGKQAGIDAIGETERRMRVTAMDLMQVHNLRDWEIQLKTLYQMKDEGKLRYAGITTSFLGQYQEFEDVMRAEKLDFVQLNYNIKVREAEKRLLPLAQDKGIAVIVNMPYEKGRLFKFVKGKSLPEWSKEFDCESWGQFFLKFILSHPAVTCAIPATSKVRHMKDNMQAMHGRLPDQKMRQKMLTYFENI
ncbi:aldo/keto reductase [Aliikangiella coralliicola]|uniref:Aldo/keto reductase n=1 Tax=Aliikangiella coralliicola TaxID=2592383 RepID=A0A545UF73_9GAMM|nr:aldo/keto reductase [Aliikangiella coralliicola]TQV88095.1 aldo/keto reductase [Aliikangiella coralliicola]